MDFSKTKFNPCKLSDIMSEPNGKFTDKHRIELDRLKEKDELTQNQEWYLQDLEYRLENYNPKSIGTKCQSYLIYLYSYFKYGRSELMTDDTSFALVKGSLTEVAATSLVSRVTAQDLFRYKIPVKNDYLSGYLDVLDAKDIEKSKRVIEIKNAASLVNFLRASKCTIPIEWKWQMQGYLALTGKESGVVYYCLVDMPDHLIFQQREILKTRLCPDGVETDLFLEEWERKEQTFRYSHIPEEERVMPFYVERDEKLIENIYEKIELCREWLAEFEQTHKKRTYGIVLDET